MTEGTIKTNKYEIVAIFREELRQQAEIEVFINNKNFITQLTHVDFAEFHISTTSIILEEHKVKFILHSDSGKIEFFSTLKKSDARGGEECDKATFALPESIQVVQRRRDPRLRLRHKHEYICHGRHKNGENYLFEIKDISDGGYALMTKKTNLKFLSHNAILKNAILSLAEYGEITVDLVIKNVVIVAPDDNEKSDSYYQVSCQFKFRHLDNKRKIAKILLDLIMESKRKKRV